MFIDSENSLFRQLTDLGLPNLIERSLYNKRRKRLFGFAEKIRVLLASRFTEFEDYFIIDSMSLEICKVARQNRVTICSHDYQTAPAKGFCASQNTWFYGYKLHGICNVSGVFHTIDITKANVHDIHFLQDVKHQIADCLLLGDKAYISANHQIDLFNQANIKLKTLRIANQLTNQKQTYIFRKSRKIIETLFSQLCDQFMIRRNYAKSFEGFKTRILAKISALTLIQFINRFVFNRPINTIKIQIT